MVRAVRWIAFGLLAWLAALGFAAATPSATDAPAVRTEVKRVFDWSGYQRDLPQEEATPHRPPPPRESSIRLPAELGQVLTPLLYGLLLVVVIALVLSLRSGTWSGLSLGAPAAEAEQAADPAPRQQLKTRLQEADQSAGLGDWARAIHILLLTSIDLLRRRVGQDVPDAMTARELVGRAQVTEVLRPDFAALVSAAELCHFGGRSADRALYDRCRVHYERLWGMSPEPAA
jgi:hypothetical protein